MLQRILRRVVGREREARAILAALAAGRNVLLQGPPGTSKSTLLKAIAEESGVDFFIVEGTADLTPQKLVGTFNPAKVMAEGFKPEFFEPGPLTRAMERGGLLYIEEFNRMSEEAANVLIRAAEEREISIPRLGVVRAKPSFRIVCAMNPYDDVGTSKVSRALLDRFVMLRMDYQSRGEEVEIVKLRSGSKRQWLIELAVDLARATRQHPAVKMGASIRGAIDMVTIAEQLIAMRGAVSLEDLTIAAIMAFSPKIWMRDPSKSPEELIEEILQSLLAKRRQELNMENPSELRDEGAGDEERVKRRGDGRDLLDKLSRRADLAPRGAAVMVVTSPEPLRSG
ncbi:MAG: ATPase, partial [Thermoprotei archaeon]